MNRLARLELPGAGQVTVEGKYAYVDHITNQDRLGPSVLVVSDPRDPDPDLVGEGVRRQGGIDRKRGLTPFLI